MTRIHEDAGDGQFEEQWPSNNMKIFISSSSISSITYNVMVTV
jgi:hypothetical protein